MILIQEKTTKHSTMQSFCIQYRTVNVDRFFSGVWVSSS